MGQFDRFIDPDKNPPSSAMRVFQVVLPILWIVKAAGSRRLEDILMAGFFVVVMLPAGIAPELHHARVAALNKRPVLGAVFMFLLLTGGLFALLAEFISLSRTTSILIATPVALTATITGTLRQRARLRAAG